MPADIKIRETLGPMDYFVGWSELRDMAFEDIVYASRKLLRHHQKEGCLWNEISMRNCRIGINSFYHVLAQTYLRLFNNELPDTVSLRAELPIYPNAARSIADFLYGCEGNFLYKPDLNMHKICKYAKLQTWTLKPVHKNR